MPQHIGTERLRRGTPRPALLRQRCGKRQCLTGIALLIGSLRLRQLVVEQRTGRPLATSHRGVAAEIRRPAQILRCGLVVVTTLRNITRARQHVSILRVGLQHLLKLLLRGGDIAAVQIGVALAMCLAVVSFVKVVPDFIILRMPLHPGVTMLLTPGLRAQPE